MNHPFLDAAAGDDDRFVVHAKLGAGGMGVVYRVHDRARNRELALKTFTGSSARDLYRFKREFRSLCDLAHPNLCALDELHTTGDEWFFTMELVRGVSFIDWVRPSDGSDVPSDSPRLPRGRPAIASATLDQARLADAFAQLVDGVLALHVAGKLHRDLKPSNVLVEPGGRVVLLDFGLVAELQPLRPEHTHAEAAVGTPAYMSPEQAADLPLTPASDLYAVGVMLFEALTGRRPFEGAATDVLRRKQKEAPPGPRVLAPDTPPAIDALCRALLAFEPGDRPDGRAVLAALGRAPSAATASVERSVAHGPFVGRRPALATLARARTAARQRGVAVLIRGRSGMGKSALLGRFVTGLGPDVVLLSGRCYERDHAPYKILDTLIDTLTDALLELRPDERAHVLASDVATVARVFPVLRRVPEIAEGPRALSPLPADPQELRTRAWTALRGLLTRLARVREVVIAVDDLQWGDLDSTGLLADLVTRRDRPPLLLVLAYREEDAGGPIVRELERRFAAAAEPGDVRTLRVEPLALDEAAELVERLAPAAGAGGATAPDAAALFRESEGHTLFLAELARAVTGAGAPTSLDQLLVARIARLPADARALLVACAVAARAISVEVVTRAAAIADPTAALTILRAERLVRSAPGVPQRANASGVNDNAREAGDRIETFHDRVRATVVEHLPAEMLRAAHRALADAYRAIGQGDAARAERVMDHLLGAGLPEEAADAAADAAAAAEQALAFQRAAELYAFALAHGRAGDPRRADMLVARAAALVNGGRLVEAAAAYADAVAAAPPERHLDLERLRVEQLLRAGRIAEGMVQARELLARIGYELPTTLRGSFAGLLKQRLIIRLRGLRARVRPAAELPAERLRRNDVLWSISSGLSFAEPVLGRLVQAWHLRDALALGEPRRLAAALGLEVGYLGGIGRPGNLARIMKVAERARELAQASGDAYELAVVEASIGWARFMVGDWAGAIEQLGDALPSLRDHLVGDRWQVDVAEIFYLGALYQRGRIAELIEHTHSFLADAVERGDAHAQHGIRVWRSNMTWLALDRPDEAARHVDEVAAERGDIGGGFHIHEWYQALARCNIDLYRGDTAAARRRAVELVPQVAAAHLMRISSIRIETYWLAGRTAVASGEVREALAAARTLERDELPWARALGVLIRAGAGEPAAFATAADALRACGMEMHSRAAGDPASLADLGVVAPERFSQVIAPRKI